MKQYLKQINEEYYQFIDREDCTVYTLKKGNVGTWGFGECWRLSVIYYGCTEPIVLACFTTKSDGHYMEKETYGHRLWVFPEIWKEANEMIARMQEGKAE